MGIETTIGAFIGQPPGIMSWRRLVHFEGTSMRRLSVGLLLGTLPFLLSASTDGQSSKSAAPSTGAPTIDKSAPAKIETATIALG